jgi:hypothetical protein
MASFALPSFTKAELASENYHAAEKKFQPSLLEVEAISAIDPKWCVGKRNAAWCPKATFRRRVARKRLHRCAVRNENFVLVSGLTLLTPSLSPRAARAGRGVRSLYDLHPGRRFAGPGLRSDASNGAL